MSSFLYFYLENLPKLKAERGVKTTEAAKTLGQEWKTLGQEIKENYKKKSKMDRERYWSEKQSLPASMISPSKYLKRQSKLHLPKKSLSSFIYYYKDIHADVRKENPRFKTSEIAKEVEKKKKWNCLKKEDKEKYIKMAEEDKERYCKEKIELARMKLETVNEDEKQPRDSESKESEELADEHPDSINVAKWKAWLLFLMNIFKSGCDLKE
ncbi:non-histone chromosomal protein 6 homolog [Centruroides sculpturatus]|uniref:non-histone chromosomal protein 6 homolog n=1 Tax=Centruroides sculpturatus TaxID=218467 RepID=UPI000C6CDFF2|nr:non-histone chromosomal protein 6 homolog [Centruroides sculpturatus]